MLPKINPEQTKAWQLLEAHAEKMKTVKMKDLFAKDKERFNKYAFCFDDLLIDLSKNILTDESLHLLLQLARECKLKDAIEAMFEGDLINETEQRSVLHTALRNFSGQPVYASGKNIMEDVQGV